MKKDLLKQNNVKWLNQNKSEMKNSAIKKYINNLKDLNNENNLYNTFMYVY